MRRSAFLGYHLKVIPQFQWLEDAGGLLAFDAFDSVLIKSEVIGMTFAPSSLFIIDHMYFFA